MLSDYVLEDCSQIPRILSTIINLDVAPSTFSRLIKGESDISPEMALELSKAFGRSPESWMQMQTNYELWKAKQHVNLEHVKVIYGHAH
jgi:addiction module HigA family antidote